VRHVDHVLYLNYLYLRAVWAVDCLLYLFGIIYLYIYCCAAVGPTLIIIIILLFGVCRVGHTLFISLLLCAVWATHYLYYLFCFFIIIPYTTYLVFIIYYFF
jgi:hypothetical protein